MGQVRKAGEGVTVYWGGRTDPLGREDWPTGEGGVVHWGGRSCLLEREE